MLLTLANYSSLLSGRIGYPGDSLASCSSLMHLWVLCTPAILLIDLANKLFLPLNCWRRYSTGYRTKRL